MSRAVAAPTRRERQDHAAHAFRQVYSIGAGDAGGAIGAAFVVAKSAGGPVPHNQMPHAYWGPGFDDDTIGRLLDQRKGELEAAGCAIERFDGEGALCRAVATRIDGGAVVGWFQGRMEWGQRALGNRSILCDPPARYEGSATSRSNGLVRSPYACRSCATRPTTCRA